MRLPPLFGLPGFVREPPLVVAEAFAEEEFVARIRAYEDHYGAGRLPYWLRYFDPVLDAEYRCRMAELAKTVAELDERGRLHGDLRVFDPLNLPTRERLRRERAAMRRVSS